MGFGNYASIADVKGVLGITGTTDDTMLRKMCEAASRSIDRYTNRFFHTLVETKYLDGASPLWVPDLLSIDASGLKTDEDGDGTFENTLATTDYILYPLDRYPKMKIEINPYGNYGSFASGVRKGVQIAGVWGYGDGISATPYVIDTKTTESIDTTETGIDVTAVTNLSPGQVILIESEQMYIYSIATLTLTVERGVNGTTAVAHEPSGKDIYIYQYPADIRQACIDTASAFYLNKGRQGIQSERLGDYSYTISKEVLYSILQDSIRSYGKLNV
jgi:hypothetical protein